MRREKMTRISTITTKSSKGQTYSAKKSTKTEKKKQAIKVEMNDWKQTDRNISVDEGW